VSPRAGGDPQRRCKLTLERRCGT